MTGSNIDLMNTQLEEIHKLFKGTLNPPQMEFLMRMHDEVRTMQKAINDMMDIVRAVKEVAIITATQGQAMERRFKTFRDKYSDDNQDLINNEEIN